MFLTPDDFYIKNGKLFCHRQGFVFVFFTKADCRFCEDLKPYFNELANTTRGIHFAYMVVTQQNYRLPSMTQGTENEITYVPLLVMFLNGEAIEQYMPNEVNPNANMHKMTAFIQSFLETQQKQTRVTLSNINKPVSFGGVPKNFATQSVCYLSFENAYA